MKVNVTYDITRVSLRSDLAVNVNKKTPVIELTGEVYSEMEEELKKRARNNREYRSGMKLGVAAIILGFASAVPISIFLIEAAAMGLAAIGVGVDDIKKYMVAIIPQKGSNRFLLITRKFDVKLDSISGLQDYKFTNKKNCPNCNKKISGTSKKIKNDDTLYECPNCGKKIILCI